MWAPDPSWRALAAGPGSTGLWLAERAGRRWVVKRLAAPARGEEQRQQPTHAGYWRREAEVALHPEVVDGPGLVPAACGAVDEDVDGVTLWLEEVSGLPPTALQVANALGRFAAATVPLPSWAATDLLGDRLRMAAWHGGWPTLQRTPLGDVAARLWDRRQHWLDRVAAGPRGRVHGDAVPGNFPGARGDDVVAVDWQCFGSGPVGTDLGYFSLSCRESFEVLLDAFVDGAAMAPEREAIAAAARVSAVYTVVSRTEWALAQAARGQGALAGKLRHPAVAGHVRALQRQFPQLEPLL